MEASQVRTRTCQSQSQRTDHNSLRKMSSLLRLSRFLMIFTHCVMTSSANISCIRWDILDQIERLVKLYICFGPEKKIQSKLSSGHYLSFSLLNCKADSCYRDLLYLERFKRENIFLYWNVSQYFWYNDQCSV